MGKTLPREALRAVIGDWLRAGLGPNPNLSELQRLTGVTRQTIADILNGKAETTDDTVAKLAEHLKLDPPQIRLVGGVADPTAMAGVLRELASGLGSLADHLATSRAGVAKDAADLVRERAAKDAEDPSQDQTGSQ